MSNLAGSLKKLAEISLDVFSSLSRKTRDVPCGRYNASWHACGQIKKTAMQQGDLFLFTHDRHNGHHSLNGVRRTSLAANTQNDVSQTVVNVLVLFQCLIH